MSAGIHEKLATVGLYCLRIEAPSGPLGEMRGRMGAHSRKASHTLWRLSSHSSMWQVERARKLPNLSKPPVNAALNFTLRSFIL
jgi:hypothetical protein